MFILMAACSLGTSSSASPSATPLVLSSGPFTLTINSPADLSVVNQSQVDLRGKVSSAAVLTVNDNTYLLEKGTFSEPIQLQEGINAVQIVASDMDGNEVDIILSITYQP